jgi:rubrerythrin
MGRIPARIFRKKESKDMSEGTYLSENPMEAPTSRRKFLAGSAAALAGGALMAVPGAALAKGDDDGANKHGRVTDVDILNYALTLEHLEATFYTQGLKKFDRGDFERYFKNNPPKQQGIKELDGGAVYEEFVRIRRHEQIHVKTLQAVIKSLGGKPVPESTYNFNKTAFTSVGEFVSVAEFLENTGVSAYDGAIAYIKAAKLQTAGATIATVEARHASYLNLVNGDEPFPKPFDKPVAPQKICEAVQAENGGFIVRSPKPYGPYKSLEALCAKLPKRVLAP